MNKLLNLSLAVICGLLLWLAWPPFQANFIIFFAFVPFFFLTDRMLAQGGRPAYRVAIASYFIFLLWNALTTWWIWLASPPGAIMAIVLNAFLMMFPAWLYARVRLHFPRWVSYVAFVCFWLVYEYLHFNWDAPWPWLALGNVFAGSLDLVQWYEYTGIMGGTVWVWASNILIYEFLLQLGWFKQPGYMPDHTAVNRFAIPAAIILLFALPICISYLVKPEVRLPDREANIVVVQPNIDPYFEKFDESTRAFQTNNLIRLSELAIDDSTKLLVWPETSIVENMEEDHLYYHSTAQDVKSFLSKYPQLKLIAGANTYTVYDDEGSRTSTARAFPGDTIWYDVFNTALLLDSSEDFMSYHKAKLVPGVEKMPYPALFGFLEDLAIDLGGTSGSLGAQKEPSVFPVNEEIKAAPIICYESVFGEYVSDYVRKGANLLTIITNDGWWDNTPGYEQHLQYGALRAIETRMFIARSANTGISAFILPDGKIIKPTEWWEPAVIKSPYIINNDMTFYTRYGDYLARIALYASVIFALMAFFGKYARLRNQS